MSDIGQVLPDYVSAKYTRTLQVLEDCLISTSDLITVDAVDLARRVNLPVSVLKGLSSEILSRLHAEVDRSAELTAESDGAGQQGAVCLLDADLNKAIGGGIRTGAITEITGPSGVGKTQFLLSALLACQLRPPFGLDRPSIYISTEHSLPTQRLQGMVSSNQVFSSSSPQPSLARILTLHCPDLETQDHVLQFQLPVVLERHHVGLVVIDSIAANYRAEDVRNSRADARGGGISSSSNSINNQGRLMANRSGELVRLGASLREFARKYNCAVLVANQVADRLDPPPPPSVSHADLTAVRSPMSSPLVAVAAGPHSSTSVPSSQNTFSQGLKRGMGPSDDIALPSDVLTLDHQQRWFSGWGDARPKPIFPLGGEGGPAPDLKVPALGLVWTNQIACRISLHRQADWIRNSSSAVLNPPGHGGNDAFNGISVGADWSKRKWRRRIRLVFAPWAESCAEYDEGVEYEIWAGGLRKAVET